MKNGIAGILWTFTTKFPSQQSQLGNSVKSVEEYANLGKVFLYKIVVSRMFYLEYH